MEGWAFAAGSDGGKEAGGNKGGAEPQRMFAKRLKLYFPVAQNIGVRCFARRVIGEKILKYLLAILLRKIHTMKGYA